MELFKPEFGLIFWMLVVFLIILGILAKYAWPVIIRSIEQRAEFIDNGVEYARKAQEDLEGAKVKIEAMIAEAHQKQLEALQETERMKRGSIEQAKREAELQIRRQVSELSLEIAGRVLRRNLSGDATQTELVNKMLDELEKK